ncbi:hypothetical protein [Microlunatus sp. Y2014]|uniref:hypothetical protein n=1 Tax=Microlunatus sp. Y2014 TaxID=3418488 RepID=UPI003DA6FB36
MGKPRRRQVGIALIGSEVVSEGVEEVLDNLVHRAGATAVSIGRMLVRPAPEGVGRFEPPTDGGASVRVLDRPLFGHRTLWVKGAPTWHPRSENFAGGPYHPPRGTEVTDTDGPRVVEFLTRAASAGLGCSVQLSASTPPGLRDDDRPRLPDGALPAGMVRTGSLASPAVREWNAAVVRDVLAALPMLTELRIDYAEYPCYTLDEVFTDFSDHVRDFCDRSPVAPDFDRVVESARGLHRHLTGDLTDAGLQASIDHGTSALADAAGVDPDGLLGWLQLKRLLAADMVADWRRELDVVAGPAVGLSVNGFAAPFGRVTGFDPAGLAPSVSSVVPKLYGMHWSMMVDGIARRLLTDNPGVDERLVVTLLARLADLVDDDHLRGLVDFGYPEPDEPHPVTPAALERKIAAAVAASGGVPVLPLVHGYGPLDDFRARLEVVAASDAAGVWINRYGYLSDAKLDAIGEVFGGSTG